MPDENGVNQDQLIIDHTDVTVLNVLLCFDRQHLTFTPNRTSVITNNIISGRITAVHHSLPKIEISNLREWIGSV